MVRDTNADDGDHDEDQELLEAIYEEGKLLHVMRHLYARSAMGEMGAHQVAREEGLDPEEASAEEIAEAFVPAYDLHLEYDSHAEESRQYLRDNYEERAREIVDATN